MSLVGCVDLGLVLLLLTGMVCGHEKVPEGVQSEGRERVIGTLTTAVHGEEAIKDKMGNAAIEQVGPASKDSDQSTDFHEEGTDQTEAVTKLEQYRALVEWIEEQGGYLKHSSLQHIPGAGVGVIATENIEKKTNICDIPPTAIITAISRLLPKSVSSALSYKLLSGALVLASEKYRGDSIWQPYIDILPEQEVGLPLLFTDEELSELEGSEVKSFADIERKGYFEQIEVLFEDLKQARPKQFEHLNRSTLVWAVTMWKSRAFSVSVPNKRSAPGLVPLADMYNTAIAVGESNVVCGQHAEENPNHFICRTSKDVRKGEELLLDYKYDPNKRCNAMLLLHYGFVIKDNPNDAVHLQPPRIKVTDSDHSQMRLETIDGLHFKNLTQERLFPLNRTTDEGYGTVNELVQFMRVTEGTDEEIQREMASEDPFQHPLSKETELKAIKAAIDYVKDAVSKYPTSAEKDSAILDQSDGLSRNVRNAVLLRYEEKRILQMNIDYLERMYKLLVEEDNSNMEQHS